MQHPPEPPPGSRSLVLRCNDSPHCTMATMWMRTIRDCDTLKAQLMATAPTNFNRDKARWVLQVHTSAIEVPGDDQMADFSAHEDRIWSLRAAMEARGVLPPIKLSSGQIQDGWHRLVAALLLGYTKVPVQTA